MSTLTQETRRQRVRRSLGRWLVLVAATALAWPAHTDWPTSLFLPALSPFVALASATSAHIVSLLALPVALLSMCYPRWFCRHGCPVGLLQELLARFRPRGAVRRLRLPRLGIFLVLATFGGACLEYPLLLWLDPLAIFNGFLNAWRTPLAVTSLVAGMALPLLLLLDLALPRLWCRRICPLGATQDLLVWPRRLLRRRSPRERASHATESLTPLRARRQFLAVCAGAAGALTVRTAGGQTTPVLRPPGSLGEDSFAGVCVRCGNCAQACPSGIIRPDFGASGALGFLTPRLSFQEDYCREDCRRCGQVCPSGAIARLTLAEKRRHVIGPAVVDLETCLLAQGRECTACIRRCPYGAIAMRSADGSFSNEPAVDQAKCNGCGACEAICPVRPARAIRVLARSNPPARAR